MLQNKTIPLLVVTLTLVTATLVIGTNSISTAKAQTAQNTFGAAVQAQATNQLGVYGSVNGFGVHQSTFAQSSPGAMGSVNCATCTPLK